MISIWPSAMNWQRYHKEVWPLRWLNSQHAIATPLLLQEEPTCVVPPMYLPMLLTGSRLLSRLFTPPLMRCGKDNPTGNHTRYSTLVQGRVPPCGQPTKYGLTCNVAHCLSE